MSAAVGAGQRLAVLHPHHQDDADGHQGEPGQDGDEDDEDGRHHQVGLPAGVRHDLLRRGLLQGEGVQADRLAEPLSVGGRHRDDVAVPGQQAGQLEGCLVLGLVQQGVARHRVAHLQPEALPKSAVKARAAGYREAGECLVVHRAVAQRVRRAGRDDVEGAGLTLEADTVLSPAEQGPVVQLSAGGVLHQGAAALHLDGALLQLDGLPAGVVDPVEPEAGGGVAHHLAAHQDGLQSGHPVDHHLLGAAERPVAHIERDRVADSVTLRVVRHAGVDTGLGPAHPLEDQAHVADDDALGEVVVQRLLLQSWGRN